jgi:hypothetical protein
VQRSVGSAGYVKLLQRCSGCSLQTVRASSQNVWDINSVWLEVCQVAASRLQRELSCYANAELLVTVLEQPGFLHFLAVPSDGERKPAMSKDDGLGMHELKVVCFQYA